MLMNSRYDNYSAHLHTSVVRFEYFNVFPPLARFAYTKRKIHMIANQIAQKEKRKTF